MTKLQPVKSKKTKTSRSAPRARKDRAKAAKKAHAAGTTPRNERVANPTRGQTKTQISIDLLNRAVGASTEELQQATGWQAHSVRGFLSATVKRKLGLTLTSDRPDDGPRRYRIVRPEASAS